MENVSKDHKFYSNLKTTKYLQKKNVSNLVFQQLWLEVKLPLQPDKLLNPSQIVDRNWWYSER